MDTIRKDNLSGLYFRNHASEEQAGHSFPVFLTTTPLWRKIIVPLWAYSACLQDGAIRLRRGAGHFGDPMKKVITYGTFDMFHNGHLNILKRAKAYGDYLIVGVTGENYDLGRGKLSVHETLAERIKSVEETGLADQIIVEEYLGQKIYDIRRYGVDVLVIGDDWRGKFDHLNAYCQVVYLPRTQGVSSAQIRRDTFGQYRIGVITDTADAEEVAEESAAAACFSVTGVYSENASVAAEFSRRNRIAAEPTLEGLLGGSDVLFVHASLEKRASYIREALLQSIHVIAEAPFAATLREQKELLKLADENGVLLAEDLVMPHIYTFNQLLWIARGGLIGPVRSVRAGIRDLGDPECPRERLLAAVLCPVLKVLGTGIRKISFDGAELKLEFVNQPAEDGSAPLGTAPEAVAMVQIGEDADELLEITGDTGTIRSGKRWWRGDFFEIVRPGKPDPERYAANYDGNGLKYVLKDFGDALRSGNRRPVTLSKEESERLSEITEVLKQ